MDRVLGYRLIDTCAPYSDSPDSSTIPPNHHRTAGGHWAVDFYGCPGTVGRFYSADLAQPPRSSWATVGAKLGSCEDTLDWKGHHYRLDLRNPEGRRGYYRVLHVDDIGFADGVHWGFGNPPYQLYQNQQVNQGQLIGFTTRRWGKSSCYAVNNDLGVHWHLEVANSPEVGSGHFSCFYFRPAGTRLWAQDWLGITGANGTSLNFACP
jgi:hypothetical protein